MFVFSPASFASQRYDANKLARAQVPAARYNPSMCHPVFFTDRHGKPPATFTGIGGMQGSVSHSASGAEVGWDTVAKGYTYKQQPLDGSRNGGSKF